MEDGDTARVRVPEAGGGDRASRATTGFLSWRHTSEQPDGRACQGMWGSGAPTIVVLGLRQPDAIRPITSSAISRVDSEPPRSTVRAPALIAS